MLQWMELKGRHSNVGQCSNCRLILIITLVTITKHSVVERAEERSQEGWLHSLILWDPGGNPSAPLGLSLFISQMKWDQLTYMVLFSLGILKSLKLCFSPQWLHVPTVPLNCGQSKGGSEFFTLFHFNEFNFKNRYPIQLLEIFLRFWEQTFWNNTSTWIFFLNYQFIKSK